VPDPLRAHAERAGVGEGEYADREQKSQRAPLDDLVPILLGTVFVVE
jgi:hypothetical protein